MNGISNDIIKQFDAQIAPSLKAVRIIQNLNHNLTVEHVNKVITAMFELFKENKGDLYYTVTGNLLWLRSEINAKDTKKIEDRVKNLKESTNEVFNKIFKEKYDPIAVLDNLIRSEDSDSPERIRQIKGVIIQNQIDINQFKWKCRSRWGNEEYNILSDEECTLLRVAVAFNKNNVVGLLSSMGANLYTKNSEAAIEIIKDISEISKKNSEQQVPEKKILKEPIEKVLIRYLKTISLSREDNFKNSKISKLMCDILWKQPHLFVEIMHIFFKCNPNAAKQIVFGNSLLHGIASETMKRWLHGNYVLNDITTLLYKNEKNGLLIILSSYQKEYDVFCTIINSLYRTPEIINNFYGKLLLKQALLEKNTKIVLFLLEKDIEKNLNIEKNIQDMELSLEIKKFKSEIEMREKAEKEQSSLNNLLNLIAKDLNPNAFEARLKEIEDLIRTKNINVNQAIEGITPLALAFRLEKLKIIKLLLSIGAVPNIVEILNEISTSSLVDNKEMFSRLEYCITAEGFLHSDLKLLAKKMLDFYDGNSELFEKIMEIFIIKAPQGYIELLKKNNNLLTYVKLSTNQYIKKFLENNRLRNTIILIENA